MPPGPTPPPRRVDDRLVPALATQVAVLQNDVGHIREAVDRLVLALDEDDKEATSLRELVEKVTADASQSPAGRELLRRAQRSEDHHVLQDLRAEKLETRTGKLEDDAIEFRAEIRGAVQLLKGFSGFITVAAALMAFLWTLHLLGVIH